MGRDSRLTTYLATGMVTAGFGLMFVAWNGAAGLDYVQGQVPFLLSGTIPGLALVLTGLTLALVHEIRHVAARLLGRLDTLQTPPAAEGTASLSPSPTPGDDRVVATGSSFHDPGCRVVAGRGDLTPMTPEGARAHGLSPCRVCGPATAAA